jgi:outer membrane protein assembly factor BamB
VTTSRLSTLVRIMWVTGLCTGTLGCEDEPDSPLNAPPSRLARSWKHAVPGAQEREIGSNGLALNGQFIFVASNRNLSAVSAATGAPLWRADGSRSSARSIGATSDFLIVPSDSLVLGVDISTGHVRWRTAIGDGVDKCVGSSTATLVVACTPAWQVVAMHAATGSIKWSVNLRDGLAGIPTLMATVISGDTIYAAVKQIYSTTVGFAQALIFALSLHDGSILSLMRVGDYTDSLWYIGRPSVVGRMLVVPHLITNRITGINRFTGRIIWRLNGDPGWVGFLWFPTVVGGIVYAASGDRRVHAVDGGVGIGQVEVGYPRRKSGDCRGVRLGCDHVVRGQSSRP